METFNIDRHQLPSQKMWLVGRLVIDYDCLAYRREADIYEIYDLTSDFLHASFTLEKREPNCQDHSPHSLLTLTPQME